MPMPRGSKSVQSKINEDDVKAIRSAVKDGVPARLIAEGFKISISNVGMIANRKTWRHVR